MAFIRPSIKSDTVLLCRTWWTSEAAAEELTHNCSAVNTVSKVNNARVLHHEACDAVLAISFGRDKTIINKWKLKPIADPSSCSYYIMSMYSTAAKSPSSERHLYCGTACLRRLWLSLEIRSKRWWPRKFRPHSPHTVGGEGGFLCARVKICVWYIMKAVVYCYYILNTEGMKNSVIRIKYFNIFIFIAKGEKTGFCIITSVVTEPIRVRWLPKPLY